MTAILATAGKNANRLAADQFGETTQLVRLISALWHTAKRLWPNKTTAEFAAISDVSTRTVEHWAAKRSGPAFETFMHMLHSEEGFHLLTAAMAAYEVEPKPQWWTLCSSLMDVAEAQRMQAAARRRIRRAVKGALNADRDITAAIARAEAYSVHDPEFYGSHADAVRATARAPHRAVDSISNQRERRRQ